MTTPLPKWLVLTLHVSILSVTALSLATQLPQIANSLGLTPLGKALSLCVTSAGWICTYFLKSPLVLGWLSLHDPEDVADAARQAARDALTRRDVPKPPKPPPTLGLAIFILVVLCTAVSGCSLFSPVVAPAEQLGQCILDAGVSDLLDIISDPSVLIGDVVTKCAPYGVATLDEIISVLEGYFAVPDASAGSAASLTQATKNARLRKLLNAAYALRVLDGGAK